MVTIITSAASAAILMIWMVFGDLSILNPKSGYDRDFAYLLTAEEKLLFLGEAPADLSVFVYAVNDRFLVTVKEIPGLSPASVESHESLLPGLVINGPVMTGLLIEGWGGVINATGKSRTAL